MTGVTVPPAADVSSGASDGSDDLDAAQETTGPQPVPLTEPRDGVPEPMTDPAELARAVEVLAAGSGPVAIDAERASGYRYGQRAYLVQLRREDVGTLLIDPRELPDLSALSAAIAGDEWVLHAASQDLPCLRELGLEPTTVFDTELAGRLLGYPKVGLGPIVEQVLGLSLEKGHSAADWSTRPLPEPWLRYAALDVEVLVELRDALAADLAEQGKTEWAEQEFAAVVAAPPAPPRVDPWRRTSGLHRVRKRRQLAVVRALWERRDEVAQRRDIAPGRVLPDAAIVGAALAGPRTEDDLTALPVWGGRSMRRQTADLAAGDPGRARPPRGRAARPQDPARGTAARAQLARARARSRRPPERGADGGGRGRRRAPAAGREPAGPRHGPPAVLGAAGERHPRRGDGRGLPA